MKILLLGGAGFLGVSLTRLLIEQGDQVLVVDNFSTGSKAAVPSEATVYECDAGLMPPIEEILREHFLDLAIDLTAHHDPILAANLPFVCHHNNFVAKFYLLQSLLRGRIRRYILASSIEVYGPPIDRPVTEGDRPIPRHALGRSLLAVEELLGDLARAEGLTYCIVRLSRLAGWDGRRSDEEYSASSTDLIPRLLRQVRQGDSRLTLHTADGMGDKTMVRNYLHILDAARFFCLLSHGLGNRPGGEIYHLGGDIACSELEIVKMVERQWGFHFTVDPEPMPDFLAPVLLSDGRKVRNSVNWKPQFDMTAIMQSLPLRQSSGFH